MKEKGSGMHVLQSNLKDDFTNISVFLFDFFLYDTACSNGTFGNDCTELCGHCKNYTYCHHINGSCLDGCKPGYIGDFCNLRKQTFTNLNKLMN